METIRIKRTNKSDIRFVGEEVGSASSSTNNARQDYSGYQGQWEELTVYRTSSGKYVCKRFTGTCWEGQVSHTLALVVDDVPGVVDFFGYSWLAKALYADADIDSDLVVE